jgi:TonB family protein
VVSATAQGTAVYAFEASRPTPQPALTIHLGGEGEGVVNITRDGDPAPLLRCSKPPCTLEVPAGTSLHMQAILGDDSTFAGFHQVPMRTPEALRPYLGDPLAECTDDGDLATAASTRDALECHITVSANTEIAAEFGLQPKEVAVAMDVPKIDDVLKPLTPKAVAPPPPAIDPEKLEDKPLEVALKPPPKIQPPKAIPPPPPPPQPKQPPPPPPPQMTMVEVKDDHKVDKAPDDAKYLSDKNRDVDEETRATQTNLQKEQEGQSVASKESDDHTSKDVGGPDDKIRQLEDSKATTDKHVQDSDHSGKEEVAKGQIKGEQGDNGDNGTGEIDPNSAFKMRDIDGRGAVNDQGKDGKKQGRKGTPGLNSQLSYNDYERIVGKDKVDDEREIAAKKMSSKKGKWEKKLDAIKSSLENFVPDVRPGNQTALKTRAHPFALYIARMHRRIHELWGFGFLEDLDNKGADDPRNDPNLWVNLEMSVNTDGTVHKVTIAKTSGNTEFDVAAVDTVISAGPYETTPEAIRSVDGRVYLRWGFYRNWRQCGTFNVEPYILSEVPDDGGQGVLDDGQMVENQGKVPGAKKHHVTGDKPVTPDDGLDKQKVSPDSQVTDKEAVFEANKFVSAFSTGEADKLVTMSLSPFYAGGKVAAQTPAELKEMWSGLIVESGLPLKDWKLLTPAEYGGGLPDGNVVVQIRTTKESFAVVLTKQTSGDWRATQMAR